MAFGQLQYGEMCISYCRMTLLYVAPHADSVELFTKLDEKEACVVGDARILLLRGEDFLGLSFDQYCEIAATTGHIDTSELPS